MSNNNFFSVVIQTFESMPQVHLCTQENGLTVITDEGWNLDLISDLLS